MFSKDVTAYISAKDAGIEAAIAESEEQAEFILSAIYEFNNWKNQSEDQIHAVATEMTADQRVIVIEFARLVIKCFESAKPTKEFRR